MPFPSCGYFTRLPNQIVEILRTNKTLWYEVGKTTHILDRIPTWFAQETDISEGGINQMDDVCKVLQRLVAGLNGFQCPKESIVNAAGVLVDEL